MKKALKRSALFILALAVSAGWVFAQTGGAISGRVTDEAGQPVIGAVINVTGPSLQGTQGTVTDVSGNFHIPFIPQGSNYQIKVTAEGYNTVVRKGIDVPLNTTITVNFALSKGKTEIVVTGSAPLIDLKRDTVGANLSDNMIQSIPLPRNSAGIAYLAPSAVTSGLADTPSIGGASGPENQYTVNGIDITGAGDALNNFNLNFDFIQAYEVKTGGLGAEYGALMGGQINAITKSGGNEFHGGVFAYYWDDGLSPSYRKLNNPTIVDYNTSQKIYDIGGFLGGYIVKDKLWFFASYDYNKTQTNRSADGTDANVSLNGGPSYSWARATGVQNDTRDPQYAAKFTYNINSNHRLELSFFGNANRQNYYASLANIAQTASPRYGKTNNYAVNLQWNATWTPNFFTQISVGTRRTWRNNHPTNQAAEDNYRYYYRYGSSTYGGYQIIPQGTPNSYDAASHHIDLSGWMPSLGGGVDADTKDYNDQINVKFTNLFDAAGHHELSYGMQYYDITYDYNFNYTGPGVTNKSPDLYDLYTYNYVPNPFYGQTSPGGAVVRWQYSGGSTYLYRAQYFMNDQAKKTTQKYYGYWAQDNWNITDYFMLKLGLRLDQIHMKGGSNSINVPNALIPGQGFATGQARTFDVNDELAPRIGFTWDVAHNGKSKLYGFYGQYYERVPNDMAIRALTDEYFTFEYYLDPALTVPIDFTYSLGLHPTQIVGGPTGQSIKGSYNNEWILGYEYEVAPNFRLGARAIYRDLGRIIEDISFDGGQTYIVTNPGNWAGTWSTGQRNGVVGLYTFPRPVRIYKALEITFDKRYSNHWQMAGSYVLSRLQGNYEGLYSNDNNQLDPNITSKYDLPQLLINGYGLLPNDRTHVLKLFGGYNFDWGLDLSANFQLQSGRPISALGSDDFYGIGEGFVDGHPRGTDGRTPTTWTLDIGAQYNFKLFKSNLGLRLDIFNITDNQKATAVDQIYNTVDTQNVQNNPYYKMETAHQFPRQIRVAVRWTF